MNLLEQGYSYDSIDAVLAVGLSSIPAVKAKIAALEQYRKESSFADLLTAFERCYKIAAKNDAAEIVPVHFTAAEKELSGVLENAVVGINEKLAEGKYIESLKLLASLRQPVDAFFDAVMIMDPDPVIRANRLGLLQQAINLFRNYADFSLIVE